jgi:DNA-binding transcriptional LysR family regulator
LDELADTRSEVSTFDQEVSGVLQISCLPTFGRRYVIPSLDRLSQDYPSLSVDIDLTERLADPNTERLDAAIRFGDLPDSKLIGNRIGTQRYVVCASPDYLNRHGLPSSSNDLDLHRLIDKRHDISPLGWREILGRRRLPQATYVLHCDDFEGQRTAALSGMGIARLPDWVVGGDVQTGELRELKLEDVPQAPTTNISILRAVPKRSAKLAAFSDCLHKFIGTPPKWLC